MSNKSVSCSLFLWGLVCGTVVYANAGEASAEPTIKLFKVPSAKFTEAEKINSAGTIAGVYSGTADCSGLCGFVRAPDGAIATFLVGSDDTHVTGINSSGATVGDSDSGGFIRSPDGTITTIGITYPSGLNDAGFVTGTVLDQNNNVHGALLAPDDTLTTFDVEAGARTYAISINNSGEIAGYYYDSKAVYHGFLRGADGKITKFDPPKSSSTFAIGIDDKGAIAGDYNIGYGFLRTPKGKFEEITVSGSGTQVQAIIASKSKDVIAGFYYYGRRYASHGFIRQANGSIQTFDAVSDAKSYAGTYARAMNSSGVVVGSCKKSKYATSHGFIYTPSP